MHLYYTIEIIQNQGKMPQQKAKVVKKSFHLVVFINPFALGDLLCPKGTSSGIFVQKRQFFHMSHAILLSCVAIATSSSYHVKSTLLDYIKITS